MLISYSELLESISASELVDVNEFDTMARDLNANVSSAAKAMNLDISGEADKGIAIFSIAASTAARLAVETKREGKLLEALQKNQEQIQTLSAKLQEAVLIAVENLWEIYEDHKREFFRQLAEASNKSKNQRRKAVEEFLQWNQDFVHRLNVLESLYLAYGALPDAHRELASTQKESGMSLGSIKELQAQGRHLYDLYKDLSKEEE